VGWRDVNRGYAKTKKIECIRGFGEPDGKTGGNDGVGCVGEVICIYLLTMTLEKTFQSILKSRISLSKIKLIKEYQSLFIAFKEKAGRPQLLLTI